MNKMKKIVNPNNSQIIPSRHEPSNSEALSPKNVKKQKKVIQQVPKANIVCKKKKKLSKKCLHIRLNSHNIKKIHPKITR